MSGPDFIKGGFNALPGLNAQPFVKGSLTGTLYEFTKVGAELPSHQHDASTVHLTIVLSGSVKSQGDGWEVTLKAGDIVAFKEGQMHNLIGLEVGSRVINIVHGH